MLIDLMTGATITSVPFQAEYKRMIALLSKDELEAIKVELNLRIEGTRVQTAGWMPGGDWRGTPFQAIYEKAARHDQGAAARCFGLMVWEVFMERSEIWTSGQFEKNGEPIGSRTYFQPNV